jgi:hypothetical protein
VAYAKVPAFRSLLDERGIAMPEPVHSLYEQLGWKVEKAPAAAVKEEPTAPVKQAPASPSPAPPAPAKVADAHAPLVRAAKSKDHEQARGSGVAGGAHHDAPKPESIAPGSARATAVKAPPAVAPGAVSSSATDAAAAAAADVEHAAAAPSTAGKPPAAAAVPAPSPSPPSPPPPTSTTEVADVARSKHEEAAWKLRLETLRQADQEVKAAGAALRRELESGLLADIDKVLRL